MDTREDFAEEESGEVCKIEIPNWMEWLFHEEKVYNLAEVITHDVGSRENPYFEDRGGIWEIMLVEQLDERKVLPAVSRMIRYSCMKCGPVHIRYWFLAILSRQEMLQKVVIDQLNQHGKEDKVQFLLNVFCPFLHKLFITTFQVASYDKLTAHSIMSQLVSYAEQCWFTESRWYLESLNTFNNLQQDTTSELLDADVDTKSARKQEQTQIRGEEKISRRAVLLDELPITSVEQFKKHCPSV